MELQWELMIFTLFICLGAGIFGIQGLLAALGKGKEIQLPAMIASLVSVGIGGIGSFLHLHHWERIFNGFGHLTSGITQELIAIVLFVIVLVIYFFVWRASEEGQVPRWAGVLAVIISVALVIIMSHSYNMSARPAWDTFLLWFYYLGNAALFGALCVMLLLGVKSLKDSFLNLIALISSIFAAVMTFIYAFYFTLAGAEFTEVGNYFDPTMPTKAMLDPNALFNSLFFGENALMFWLGVVVVGLLIPIITTILAKKKEPKQIVVYSAVGLIAALVGGMCFRALLYILGASVFIFY